MTELSEPYADEFEEIPSAENLESAVDSLIESLARSVEDLDMSPDFEDGVVGVRRDANALAVVAMTLGASDYDSPLQGVVTDLLESANLVEQAKSGAEVKKAYQQIVAVRAKTGKAKKLDWKKVAALHPLMKYAVPSLATDVKRLTRNEKTFLRGKNTRKVIDDSTILVAIALGCRENVEDTLAPSEEKLWLQYCERLASASLELNKQANLLADKKGSFDDLKTAAKEVEATCNSTCHEKFGGKSAQ